MLFRFHIFAIGLVLVAKLYILNKRSVYARLVGENVRSFQKMARECNGSRVSRGLVAISSIKGISHNLHLEKWLISTTILLCRILPVLFAVIWVVISAAWIIGIKYECERNFSSVLIYNSLLYKSIPIIMLLVFIAFFIANWVYNGFLSSLIYLGVGIATRFIGSMLIIPLLIDIFGYSGSVAIILPMISCIVSSIVLFVAL